MSLGISPVRPLCLLHFSENMCNNMWWRSGSGASASGISSGCGQIIFAGGCCVFFFWSSKWGLQVYRVFCHIDRKGSCLFGSVTDLQILSYCLCFSCTMSLAQKHLYIELLTSQASVNQTAERGRSAWWESWNKWWHNLKEHQLFTSQSVWRRSMEVVLKEQLMLVFNIDVHNWSSLKINK